MSGLNTRGFKSWTRARLCLWCGRELQRHVASNGIIIPEVHEGVTQQHGEAVVSTTPHPSRRGAQQDIIGRGNEQQESVEVASKYPTRNTM